MSPGWACCRARNFLPTLAVELVQPRPLPVSEHKARSGAAKELSLRSIGGGGHSGSPPISFAPYSPGLRFFETPLCR